MRPHGKYAKVNPGNPEAFAQCDRCGFWRNRTDLTFQIEWAGTHLYNTGSLVCRERCLDTPQEQFRTIILPPDPMSVVNARTPDFAYEEQTVRITQYANPVLAAAQQPYGAGPQMLRATQDGEIARLLQYLTSV